MLNSPNWLYGSQRKVIVEQMIQAGVEGISHPTDLEKALAENIRQRRSKRFAEPDPQ